MVSFEGHSDNRVTLFSKDDTRAKQMTQHIGCQVSVQACMLSVDYTTEDETETRPTKAKVLGQPITKMMRQSRDGRNHVKQGMTKERTTERIYLS